MFQVNCTLVVTSVVAEEAKVQWTCDDDENSVVRQWKNVVTAPRVFWLSRWNVCGESNPGERVADERRVWRRVAGHTVNRFRDRVVGYHQGTVQGARYGRVHSRCVPDRLVEDMSDSEKDQLYVEWVLLHVGLWFYI